MQSQGQTNDLNDQNINLINVYTMKKIILSAFAIIMAILAVTDIVSTAIILNGWWYLWVSLTIVPFLAVMTMNVLND